MPELRLRDFDEILGEQDLQQMVERTYKEKQNNGEKENESDQGGESDQGEESDQGKKEDYRETEWWKVKKENEEDEDFTAATFDDDFGDRS